MRNRYVEKGLLTSGDDVSELLPFLPLEGLRYNANDVFDRLLSGLTDLGQSLNNMYEVPAMA